VCVCVDAIALVLPFFWCLFVVVVVWGAGRNLLLIRDEVTTKEKYFLFVSLPQSYEMRRTSCSDLPES
jgi:hypothetical protein